MVSRRTFMATTAATAFFTEIARIKAVFAGSLETEADLLPGREAYLLDPEVTYLNHASIGTVPKLVYRAYTQYLRLCERNPWHYIFGEGWEHQRGRARESAAQLLGTRSDRLAITHNVTEAFNLLAHGLPLGTGDEVLFSDLNHPAASVPFFQQSRQRGFKVRRFPFAAENVASMDEAEVVERYSDAITRQTRLLVLPHIDNMVGLKHPLAAIAGCAREKGVAFVAADGAQSAGAMPLDLDGLGVDLYAMNGHKWLQAPKETGLTYFSAPLQADLQPMWTTWGQQRWAGTVRVFEDYGTRDLAAVLSIEDAIEFHRRLDPEARQDKLAKLRSKIRRTVDGDPRLTWRSPTHAAASAGGLMSFSFASERAERSFARLFPRAGLVFRPFTDPIDMIRLSPNFMTQEKEIDKFFDCLLNI